MSGESKLTAQVLLLGSGALNPSAEEIIRSGLSPFVHQVEQVQRIDLGGRTIIALLIRIDPAHFEAIEDEMISAGAKSGLDIALDLL